MTLLKITPLIKCLLTAAIASGACTVSAQVLEPDKLFEKISPSVWVINTFDEAKKPLGQGSAVVIAPGTLITNCHVLAKAKSFLVNRDNVMFGATLEHADVERDLCQVQVKNFTAPAVEIAATTGLRVGQKVYAIGNPRGMQVTFSDGLISGLRKSADDKTIELVQTTAPISPGSSGGGLFDARGRLVGITTLARKESQNLNFAMPADWIREVPARSETALANRRNAVALAAPATAPAQKKGSYFVGQKWDYAVVERMTSSKRMVRLRVDSFDGDHVVFNGSNRVEDLEGRIVSVKGRPLSEMDVLNSVGGWIHGGTSTDGSLSIGTVTVGPQLSITNLEGRYFGDSRITTPAGDFDVREFRFTGFRQINGHGGFASAYEVTAWFAPKLNRIVKFSATTMGTRNRIDEEVVLEKYEP
jgi:serine protease Do